MNSIEQHKIPCCNRVCAHNIDTIPTVVCDTGAICCIINFDDDVSRIVDKREVPGSLFSCQIPYIASTVYIIAGVVDPIIEAAKNIISVACLNLY